MAADSSGMVSAQDDQAGGKIGTHITARDCDQSLWGWRRTPEEFTKTYANVHLIADNMQVQTTGGQGIQGPARHGYNAEEYVKHCTGYFQDRDVRQSALFRGDFAVALELQAYDVIQKLVMELAKQGVNVLQNFHGMNDIRLMRGPQLAVREAQDAGYDIVAQGTICIEDNPNIKVDSCLKHAENLIKIGHRGLYLKSANGVLRPDFTYELTDKLCQNFDEEIGIHVHATYGHAIECYMAAIEAALGHNRRITPDTLAPLVSGSTGQPNILKLQYAIENHPNAIVRANAPRLNYTAIEADAVEQLRQRFVYGGIETKYIKKLLEALEACGGAGGAAAFLRQIPGLEQNLGRLLGTTDWNEIEYAVYVMQKDVRHVLGDPNQITPYMANTTGQASISLKQKLEGKDPYAILYPGAANYAVGKHGIVSPSIDPQIQQTALKQLGMTEVVDPVSSLDRPPALPEAEARLKAAGIENPTTWQKLLVPLTHNPNKPDWSVQYVVDCANGKNVPPAPPNVPFYAQPLEGEPRTNRRGYPIYDMRHVVQAVGGIEMLERIALSVEDMKRHQDGKTGDNLLTSLPRDNELARLSGGLNMQQIVEWLNEAEQIVNEFSKQQPWAETVTLSYKFEPANRINKQTFYGMLQDVIDRRGPGLYDFAIKEMQALCPDSEQTLSVPHLAAEEAVA